MMVQRNGGTGGEYRFSQASTFAARTDFISVVRLQLKGHNVTVARIEQRVKLVDCPVEKPKKEEGKWG
jgi:hypothetical protein